MKKRMIALLTAVLLLMLSLSGCGDTVGKIAGNVADAAMEELKNQIKLTLEENKLTVVEMKTAFGALNGEGEHQFFCAALVKSDATMIPQSTADGLSTVFTDAGLIQQTGAKIDSTYLEHKELAFSHSDYSDGSYYVIFVYHEDITASMPKITIEK